MTCVTYVYIIQHLWILWREMWLHGFPRWGTCFVGTMCATFAVLQVPMLSKIWSWIRCKTTMLRVIIWIHPTVKKPISSGFWKEHTVTSYPVPFVLHGPKGEESCNKCENLHFSRFVVLSFRSIWGKHKNGNGCAWGGLVFVVDTKGDRWGWVRLQPKWIAELDTPYLKIGCLTYM